MLGALGYPQYYSTTPSYVVSCFSGEMGLSRAHDARHLISQKYRGLGSEILWKSLDEVDVLGHPGGRDRTAYGHTGQA